jgi:membrane-bound metal-dependent hydrolase YbcI (DUF457 family)
MWPWEHLAFGYVLYSLWRRLSGRPPPTDATALALAFGTQFPDLIDKPLAWSFGVLPNGRSLTHSVITATLVVAVVLYVAHRRDRPTWGTAFAAGYYSHVVGDAVSPLLSGSWYELAFLLWPVYAPVEYGDGGFVSHFAELDLTSLFVVRSLLLLVPALALWAADGTPGTALVGWIRRRVAPR